MTHVEETQVVSDDVQVGSFTVKIYKVRNKGRESFTVSYLRWKAKTEDVADFDEAHEEAESKAISLSKGELDVVVVQCVLGEVFGLY